MVVLDASPHKSSKPYVYNGRPYRRIESTTSIMPHEYFLTLLEDKIHHNNSWDNLPATQITIDDLDQDEILKTLKEGIHCGRISPANDTTDPLTALMVLNLIVDNALVNAAAVLFGTKIEQYYPQCSMRLARFKGKDKSEFLDSKQLSGHVFKLLDDAYHFMDRHLPIASTFDAIKYQKGLERTDIPTLPPEAIREALVNAFAHRDYSLTGGAISIAIYDDRLEIWSDGRLPQGIEINQLSTKHPSKLRNKRIAEVLYRRKMIESWGSGTLKIISLCEQAGLPRPEFREIFDSFVIEFPFRNIIGPLSVKSSIEKPLNISKRQQAILEILKVHRSLSLKEIVDQLPYEVHQRLIRDDLYRLKEYALIDTQGHGRGSVWYIIKQIK